ncbi:MAG TPA: class I SAM-dependent methyltransferase [Candidatus Dormibacteraeota bacterium]|nr:class I SAM-dependent methyltransferase [Candidatus Dormibacteraeota bacterium]
MTERIDFAHDAFRGTADFYARFRPPYPGPLLDDLAERVRPSGRGRMVDLACGTGQVALPLAGHFAEVIAVDREPEMVATGERLAAERGVRNVAWRTGDAEALDLPAGSCELVTIGSAFHRLDRPAVARRAFTWLCPGGTIAVLAAYGLWDVDAPWARAIVRAVAPFQPPRRRAEAAAVAARDRPQADILAEAGFADLEDREYTSPTTWTAADVVGYLLSTSQCSPSAVGAERDAFEAAVREALAGAPEHRLDLGFRCLSGRKPVGPPRPG